MIIFDVGANTGGNSAHFKNDKNNTVYAFEPTPFLIKTHLNKLKDDNYIIIDKAVSDFSGYAEFNIAGQSDWGCSSLNTFEDNLTSTWPGRGDFIITEKINVEVIRLDDFIKNNNILLVDYLHCDTQGNDLKVLKSFGEEISKLKAGVVEGFRKNPLYKDIDNSVDNIVSFLQSNDFKITRIEDNDHFSNECNIFFER
jgi:FkbM family methyltransferase